MPAAPAQLLELGAPALALIEELLHQTERVESMFKRGKHELKSA